jgi:PPE-repeat protein
LDLRTGAVQEWFRKRGVFPNVIGFDWTGRPVVVLGQTLGDLVVVTGASSVQPITGGMPDVTFSQAIPSLLAFSGGFWFAADQGLFSYSGNVGFQKLWSNPTPRGLYVAVAGPCV